MTSRTSVSHRGQSIRLFLVDGSASGLISATMPNWTGSVLTGRITQLPALLSRPESRRAGCYILQGEDQSHPFGVRSYIGQAAPLQDRLGRHAREKEFWNTAALISTSDSNFTAGHFLALESRLIQIAIQSRRSAIENKVSPNLNAGSLGEADQADIESFIDQLLLVLPVVGFSLLQPSLGAKPPQGAAHSNLPADTKEPMEALELRHRSGVHAKAFMRADEFVVLKGSQATTENPGNLHSYSDLRRKLIDQGLLVRSPDTTHLIFNQETAFSSSSAAAAVILNRQANGLREWKIVKHGISLGEWQNQQAQLVPEETER